MNFKKTYILLTIERIFYFIMVICNIEMIVFDVVEGPQAQRTKNKSKSIELRRWEVLVSIPSGKFLHSHKEFQSTMYIFIFINY